MNVHRLHGGAAGALAQVVESRHQNDLFAAAEHEKLAAIGVVAALHVEVPAIECAEVRLRRSFVGAGPNGEAYRRLDDDVPVWAWHRSNVTLAACWEIRLPFLAPSGERIGSLVLWQDGRGDDVSLADMHAIAHDLRAVIEQKLLALWEPWDDEVETPVAMAGDRALPSERPVPIARSVERAPLAIEKDRAAGAKGDAGRERGVRTPSGNFRLRSAPLT